MFRDRRLAVLAAAGGGESARVTISRVPTVCPVCRRRGSGRWLCIATQTSDPLVSAGTLDTNVGRHSSGQKYTSSLGQGLWQRTRRAVSAGMPTACNSKSVAGGWILRMGGVKVDGLRIQLCRRGGTSGNIDVDS